MPFLNHFQVIKLKTYAQHPIQERESKNGKWKESAMKEPFDLIRFSLDERIYVMLWSKNELHNKL